MNGRRPKVLIAVERSKTSSHVERRNLRSKRHWRKVIRMSWRRMNKPRTKTKKKILTCAIYEFHDPTIETGKHHRRRACHRSSASFHSSAGSLGENQNPAALPESAGGKPLAGSS